VRHFWPMAYRQLSTEERYQIAALRQQGLSARQIAAALRRHPSTIAREVKRNATRHDGAYRPSFAVEMTNGRRRRSRRNARYGPIDFGPIEGLLQLRWSPEQIVGRRRRLELPVMSHETIYLWIWRDKEQGGSLWTHLRGACKRRRKRYGRYDSRGRLAGKRPIQDRPSVVAERRRFGDWEADTVHGKGKPCLATAVERKSGLVRIGALRRATVEHTTRVSSSCSAANRTPCTRSPRTTESSSTATKNSSARSAPPSTSPRRITRGNAAPTKTPTGSSANTPPRAPPSPA
jgi:transposase, IS30 family